MKTTIITKLGALLALAIFITASKPNNDCKAYFPMEKGTTFEITNYNDKDKLQSRLVYEVENVTGTSDITASIRTKMYDKKDKEVSEMEYDVMCVDGKFKIDMKGMMHSSQLEQLESMENMEMTIENDHLEFPASMAPGDKLEDASITIKIDPTGTGMGLMEFSTHITNRKVEARESITTPAGTFDCLKISSTVSTKTGFAKFEVDNIEWLAEDVGMVRSESYRKGKMDGYSLLTKFSK